MQDDYKDLRGCIYTNESEFKRFRQLVVNTVLATDIFDKELGAIRKNRWNKAFNESSDKQESSTDAANRKATIVIEHLIQASDVSHCMQVSPGGVWKLVLLLIRRSNQVWFVAVDRFLALGYIPALERAFVL